MLHLSRSLASKIISNDFITINYRIGQHTADFALFTVLAGLGSPSEWVREM